MFNLFNKKPRENFPFQHLEKDVHSHILPGLDDGAPDYESAERLIKGLQELGFSSFTATPHVMCDMFGNTREKILACHGTFLTAMNAKGTNYPITPAAEYLVDEQLEQLLKAGEPLLTIYENRVLIEISFIQPPQQLHEVLFELQLQGYQPVFAHPERYSFYFKNKNDLKQIYEMGCLFQCNLLSFGGYYGKPIQQFAEWIADQGWVRLLGTDLHHERHLEALRNLPFTNGLQKALKTLQN